MRTPALSALAPWVSVEHLSRVVAPVSEKGSACLLLDGFLTAQVGDELADFVTNDARLEPAYRLYSGLQPVPPERWANATETDRFAKAAAVAGAHGDRALSSGAVRYVRLLHMLRSQAFRDLLETIRGTRVEPTHELAAWSMTADDFVRPHRYDAGTCGVRAELWLSTGWGRSLGGALCALDVQERVTRIPFRHNALLLMEPSAGATFWVAPIRRAAVGAARVTVAACFGRAPENDGVARR